MCFVKVGREYDVEKAKRRPKGPPKPNNRPKKYRKWDDESMSGAIKSVMDGKMGINRAADQYQWRI